jgi:hypothetical protein
MDVAIRGSGVARQNPERCLALGGSLVALETWPNDSEIAKLQIVEN